MSSTNQLHKQHPPAKLVEIGQQLYRDGKFEDASEAFSAAIFATKPSRAPVLALDGRAAAQEKLDHLDAALKDARQMIEQYKDTPNGYLRTGKILKLMDKPDLAAKIYQHGIKHCRASDGRQYQMLQKQAQASSTEAEPQAIDPLAQLPFELLETIFSMMPFNAMCTCLKVTKAWRSLLTSTPTFWQSIDLSSANKPVRIDDALAMVKYSKGKARRIELKDLTLQGTKVLERITRQSPILESLSIITGGELSPSLTRALRFGRNLHTLNLGRRVRIGLEAAAEVVTLCPQLIDLRLDRVMNDTMCNPKPSTAMNLKRFAVTIYSPNYSLLLESILLPTEKLEVLDVKNPLGGRTIIHSVVKSAPSLKTIRLDANCERAGEVNNTFLMALPRSITTMDIEQLAFARERSTADPHDLVTWQDAKGEPYFHRLSDIRLSGSGMFDLQMVQALLSSQQSSNVTPCKLSSFVMQCAMISGEDVSSLLSEPRLEHITFLGFGTCQMVDDSHARLIATNLKRLRKIDLSRTKVSGVAVRVLVESLPNLYHLNLSDCMLVAVDAVDWARSNGLTVTYSLSPT